MRAFLRNGGYLLLAAAVAAIVVAYVITAESLQARFAKLEAGMTEAEVRAIMGRPTSNHILRDGTLGIAENDAGEKLAVQGNLQWNSDHRIAVVWLGPDGTLVFKAMTRSETPVSRVRRWVGL